MNPDLVNYVIGVIGLILAVIGIALTIKSNRKKEPVYSIQNTNVISELSSFLESLKITYRNKKIENLSVSHIIFYNRGSETIVQEDINTVNRLKILVRDGIRILDAAIVRQTSLSNQFKLYTDDEDNQVLIDFDYIDKNQGAMIQIIHTGLKATDIKLVGDIKGVDKMIEIAKRPLLLALLRKAMESYTLSLLSTIISILFFVILIFTVVYSILVPDTLSQVLEFLRHFLNSNILKSLIVLISIPIVYFLFEVYRLLVRNNLAPFRLDDSK